MSYRKKSQLRAEQYFAHICALFQPLLALVDGLRIQTLLRSHARQLHAAVKPKRHAQQRLLMRVRRACARLSLFFL